MTNFKLARKLKVTLYDNTPKICIPSTKTHNLFDGDKLTINIENQLYIKYTQLYTKYH